MTQRQITQIVPASTVSEGAGVTVHRTIGTPSLRHLDPFLMLDHFGSDDPDDYIAGFPEHPHRGFVTLTYMIDGHMLHQDSMGNRGDLKAGGAQWMKAASGVLHSEMPQQTAGLMRGFQLWINLPAREKMSDPGYQEFAPERIPAVEEDGRRIRVISGRYGSAQGPVEDPHTAVHYFDVDLDAGHRFTHAVNPRATVFLHLIEGAATVNGMAVPLRAVAVMSPGEEITVDAGSPGTRFILVAGLPVGEPIVQYGPFVMNTREEIEQAMVDYRNNRLVRKKASFTSD